MIGLHVSPLRVPAHTYSPLLFLFTLPAPTEIYTLSLHDALPIYETTGLWPARRQLLEVRLSSPLPDLSSNWRRDRKSTRLNSSHRCISYAVFCLKKKNTDQARPRISTERRPAHPRAQNHARERAR